MKIEIKPFYQKYSEKNKPSLPLVFEVNTELETVKLIRYLVNSIKI